MPSTLARGLVAGTAGVTALNAVSYLDMLVTGRPASDAPTATVAALLDRAGVSPPHDKNSRSALGALAGIGTGLAVGVATSAARRIGVRLPAPVGAVLAGAAAMAATDAPMALLGVSDPRRWAAGAWARDIGPHLAYGVAVRSVLDGWAPPREEPFVGRRPSRGLITRSTMLGFAAGCRSSLGLGAPALATGTAVSRAVAAGMLSTELVVDKFPATPSRLEPPALLVRYGSGAAGGLYLARNENSRPFLPMVAAMLGTALGASGGALWREYAAGRGWDKRAALVEDSAALGLAALACRR